MHFPEAILETTAMRRLTGHLVHLLESSTLALYGSKTMILWVARGLVQ